MRRHGFVNEAQGANRPCASSRVLGDLAVVAASYVAIPATFTMHKWGSADG